jgi:hypothetical protein
VSVTEPPTLSLTATAEKRRGVNGVLLQWSPAMTVDIWRSLDGGEATLIAVDVEGAEYWDAHGRGKDAAGSWSYFVCSSAVPSACSSQVMVSF